VVYILLAFSIIIIIIIINNNKNINPCTLHPKKNINQKKICLTEI